MKNLAIKVVYEKNGKHGQKWLNRLDLFIHVGNPLAASLLQYPYFIRRYKRISCSSIFSSKGHSGHTRCAVQCRAVGLSAGKVSQFFLRTHSPPIGRFHINSSDHRN